MLALALLAIGVISRLITHAPNFNPVIAIALFSGVYVSRKYAIILPLALMVLSDAVIGFHDTIFFTWGSVALIAAIGVWVRNRKNPATIIGSTLFSAVLFFIITNFGAWLSLYPMTQKGFIDCYTLAIPFFRTTLLSTAVYAAVFFITYELIALRVKDTRFARALLTT
ncbi:MAG: DUF6580 family putative transport protein [Candidatus Omnitrophota bacterium]